MQSLKLVLIIFTVLVFGVTYFAVAAQGFFWPPIFFGDLLQLGWRAQFDADFVMHLLLLGTWAWWREGGGARGWIIGFLCVSFGGMFTFPYFLYLLLRNKGNLKGLFFGVHANSAAFA